MYFEHISELGTETFEGVGCHGFLAPVIVLEYKHILMSYSKRLVL